MEAILKFLRDPAWQGIAGIAAIFTLALVIADKISPSFRFWLENFGVSALKLFQLLVYASYGLLWGVPTMLIMFISSDFINYFAQGNARLPGIFGDLLLRLSELKFIFWAFNPNMPILKLQFGALGLYGGSLIGFSFFLYKGYHTDRDYSWIPKTHHYIAVYALFFIVLVAIRSILHSILK